jgi:hypothetical protein
VLFRIGQVTIAIVAQGIKLAPLARGGDNAAFNFWEDNIILQGNTFHEDGYSSISGESNSPNQ